MEADPSPELMAMPEYGGFENLQVLISSGQPKPHHLLKAVRLLNHQDGNQSNKSSTSFSVMPLPPDSKYLVNERFKERNSTEMKQTPRIAFGEKQHQADSISSDHSNVSVKAENETNPKKNDLLIAVSEEELMKQYFSLPLNRQQRAVVLGVVSCALLLGFIIVAHAVWIQRY